MKVTITHMLHIPTIVFLAHVQDQPEMGDNCSSGENHISLVQASQIPVRPLEFHWQFITPRMFVKFGNNVIISQLDTHNTNMVPVVKPVANLNTAAYDKMI